MSFPTGTMTEETERELLVTTHSDVPAVHAALALYEPYAELQAWADTLELATTDEDRAEIQARIGQYLQQGKAAVDQFNAGWAFLDSQVALAKAEEERIFAIRRRLERLQGEMERGAILTLEALSVKKLEGNTSFLRIQKKPDAVEVTDAAAVPLEYKTATISMPAAEAETVKQFFPNADVTFTVSRSAVSVALKAGTAVPGAHLKTNDQFGRGHNALRRK